MHRRDFLVALPLLASLEVRANDSMPFDGVWKMDVPVKGAQKDSKYVMIKQTGNRLKLRDLHTGDDYTGVVHPGGIIFNMSLGGPQATGYPTSFMGTITQGTLSGQTEVAGEKVPWMAARLTSVYTCSNHKPTHIAKSKDEMEKNTKDKKCEGWKRARPDSLASSK
jgi:hypothetical protein